MLLFNELPRALYELGNSDHDHSLGFCDGLAYFIMRPHRRIVCAPVFGCQEACFWTLWIWFRTTDRLDGNFFNRMRSTGKPSFRS